MSFRSWEGRQRSVGWSSEKASWRLLERGQGHVKRVSAIFGWGSKGWQRDLQEEPRVSMGAEALRSSAWWVWGEGRTRVQGQSCLAAHLSPLSSFDSLSSHPCLVFLSFCYYLHHKSSKWKRNFKINICTQLFTSLSGTVWVFSLSDFFFCHHFLQPLLPRICLLHLPASTESLCLPLRVSFTLWNPQSFPSGKCL